MTWPTNVPVPHLQVVQMPTEVSDKLPPYRPGPQEQLLPACTAHGQPIQALQDERLRTRERKSMRGKFVESRMCSYHADIPLPSGASYMLERTLWFLLEYLDAQARISSQKH